jgi:hypothetical protein
MVQRIVSLAQNVKPLAFFLLRSVDAVPDSGEFPGTALHQQERHLTFRPTLAAGTALLALMAAHPAMAGFKIGSGNEAVIEPPITVPKETPCEVQLFTGAVFGANNADFTYTPPAGCPGPYAKIVLDVGISLDKGIQYDRTGTIWIAGVPFWFGTTAEPSPDQGPRWKFQRDVTDFTSLLTTTQSGFALIANYTNSTDTSVITAQAKLLFYPATTQYPAPRTPDLVLPLSAAGGGTVALNTGTDTLSTTVTLPTNIENAVLDVYLQGQSNDEFWYSCVPNTFATELESCGGGPLREGEVAIDGTPAGVSPVYPWIFTGGLDPYLWFPIPGVQTLDFKPFHVPLAPFAGVLSNGSPHTISLSAYGANGYFSAAGALKIYLDPNATTVTGSVTKNTLMPAPNNKTANTITSGSNAITGVIDTLAHHDFTITGTVITSAGKVTNTVQQTTAFSNKQKFDITNSLYVQDIDQLTTTVVKTTQTSRAGSTAATDTYTYPLTVDIKETVDAKGNGVLTNTIDQQFLVDMLSETNGAPSGQSTESNAIQTTDNLEFNASGNITGNKGMKSTATYLTTSSSAPCFERVLTAAANVLTGATTGCSH